MRRGAIGQVVAIEVDAPNGGRGGSTQEIPVPDGLDYQMWLGPAPVTPYTADRCKPPGTYWIYDQSIGYLGGWGAHPLDIMVWGSDADLSGLIVVEGTGTIPTEGLYDTVYNWDMKIKLGEVDLVFRPGSDRTKFIGQQGWIQVCRDRNQTMASDPALLQTKVDPERVPVDRQPEPGSELHPGDQAGASFGGGLPSERCRAQRHHQPSVRHRRAHRREDNLGSGGTAFDWSQSASEIDAPAGNARPLDPVIGSCCIACDSLGESAVRVSPRSRGGAEVAQRWSGMAGQGDDSCHDGYGVLYSCWWSC